MSSATASQPFVFQPSARADAADRSVDVVGETRREIAEIVREVAAAVRSDRSQAQFVSLLADRTLRAMAAEGVVFWQRDSACDSLAYRCVHRIGRVTDRSIADECRPAHERLLAEIGAEGSPVVVPATPGAVDPDVPSNPTETPAALVPIDGDGSLAGSDYIFEVFLEPGGGVATQRGYLRFVAQMADLAGEFLRADQLRSLRRRESVASMVDDLTAQMHRCNDRQKLGGLIVDGAADGFGFDRVGLLKFPAANKHHASPELIAVSHVHAIDQKSAAAQQLRQVADFELNADGCRWFDSTSTPKESGADAAQDGKLSVRAIAAAVDSAKDSADYRLVGMQVSGQPAITDEFRDQWVRFATHADLAMRNIDPVHGRRAGATWTWWSTAASPIRRCLAWGSLATVLTVAAVFPIPLVIDAPAVIRPADAQMVFAPRNATVDSIVVRHGDAVVQGQTLLTLSDDLLDEEIGSLISELGILYQQERRFTRAMADASSANSQQIEKTQSDVTLVAEKIASANERLELLRMVQKSLVVTADRDGVVDAWQIESQLQSRPVARGDALMRVIAADSKWWVEARVPQNRVAHLQHASSSASPQPSTVTASDGSTVGQPGESKVVAQVSLDSDPGHIMQASLVRIGPAVMVEGESFPATATLLQLNAGDGASILDPRQNRNPSGAPARAMFRCGYQPAAYVLFQDLYHAIRDTTRLYLAGASSESRESS
ncbi:efflux RND transporter periplasmic adaptor subunit [Rubripirellula lacrimiformis]|uniref:HlyD family efflux transporter periplasmic adaptor subunit n=1 Tax=Rubripirellula lacrimiformis TaxID=1930273 RepID=UPI001C54D643|nr:HlyD family efflux transporter periplasmic adaptor subunit [Rubripirellula lacrimiformis]